MNLRIEEELLNIDNEINSFWDDEIKYVYFEIIKSNI